MKTWAIINQKGGVGKTTTAITLAGHLCSLEKRLLLVDLDPHGSLSAYLGYDPDQLKTGIYNLFVEPSTRQTDLAKMLLPTPLENTWLFSASAALATLDREMGTGHGKGLVVARALECLANRFQYSIIDCPPMLGILMINALAACDQLLIPAQTDYLSLKGLDRMIHTLGMVEKSLSKRTPYLIVPTMYDKRTRASVDALAKMRQVHQSRVWESVIPIDTKFRDASKAGMPLSVYLPKSKGSQAYLQLIQFLLDDTQADQSAQPAVQKTA